MKTPKITFQIHETPPSLAFIEAQNGNSENCMHASSLKRLTSSPQNFDSLVRTTVDEAFSSLGPQAKKSIYVILSKNYGINKRQIPQRIQELSYALESIFGLGGKLVEIQIVQRLYQKVGDSFEYIPKHDELIFAEYVKALKLFLQNRNSLDIVVSIENPQTSQMAMQFRTRCL